MTILNKLKNCKLWYDYDIQNSLDYLNQNQKEKSKMIKAINNYYDTYGDYMGDRYSMLYCIKESIAEYFYNYDSDMIETYIRLFQKTFLED